jgi:hypothetical protein
MKPTAHNRTPKRITLKKHESIVDMMQQTINRLEQESVQLDLAVKKAVVDHAYDKAMIEELERDLKYRREMAERDRLTVNALIGHKEA